MIRRALAGAALVMVLAAASGAASTPSSVASPAPSSTPSMVAAASTTAPAPTSTPVLSGVLHPPRTIRIETDPPTPTAAPIPTVEDAKAWALATLGPRDYQALYWIVWSESKWDPAAVNRRSGACGLGQFWPCSKMSATLPDWRVQPIAQLRDYVIPYARKKYGSLPGAWAAWQRRGWW